MSKNEIEFKAQQLIQEFQPDVLAGRTAFDIEEFCELDLKNKTGLSLHYSMQLPSGIHGLTSAADSVVMIDAELAENPLNRKFLRSTMSHEVGHALLHVPTLKLARKMDIVFKQEKSHSEKINLYRKSDIPVYRNPEWQAWQFAGALLMPKQVLENLLKQGAPIWVISEHFQINIPFLRSRMRALGFKN
ncbi:MAG: ImmA/IrrE family metallo-endopeptidase [Deltaproteobacteria bacterium]|nr:ImmA/IrrE family metallo-endopeptidase [Deltaproteobacteria bacterium]